MGFFSCHVCLALSCLILPPPAQSGPASSAVPCRALSHRFLSSLILPCLPCLTFAASCQVLPRLLRPSPVSSVPPCLVIPHRAKACLVCRVMRRHPPPSPAPPWPAVSAASARARPSVAQSHLAAPRLPCRAPRTSRQALPWLPRRTLTAPCHVATCLTMACLVCLARSDRVPPCPARPRLSRLVYPCRVAPRRAQSAWSLLALSCPDMP